MNMKARKLTPRKVGIEDPEPAQRKPSMLPSSAAARRQDAAPATPGAASLRLRRLLGDVDLLEVVVAERILDEAAHLAAHRHGLQRVRDRRPRRLLLEDLLRLLRRARCGPPGRTCPWPSGSDRRRAGSTTGRGCCRRPRRSRAARRGSCPGRRCRRSSRGARRRRGRCAEDCLRYSPHSIETISASTPIAAKSAWISSAMRRAFGL